MRTCTFPTPTRLSDIPAKPIQWLWQNRIPKGKLSLLAGDPASGKTTLTLHLAAQLSQGQPLPDPQSQGIESLGSSSTLRPSDPAPSDPAATLLLSPEDNAADSLRPRLEALGANLDHIHILQDFHSLIPSSLSTKHQALSTMENPLEHLDQILASIPNLALLVIDPITHYLGLTDRLLPLKSTPPTAPRSILFSLAKLAEKHNIAILLTTRLTKRTDPTFSPQSLQRTLGSLAFAAAARTINLLLPYSPHSQDDPSATLSPSDPEPSDPSSPPNRLLLTIKSNHSALPPHLPLRIDHSLTWYPDHPILLPTPTPPKPPGPFAIVTQHAVLWLQNLLAQGPLSACLITEDAKTNAISFSTLNRAKALAGIQSLRQDLSNHWFWRLPHDPRPIPQLSPEDRGLHEMLYPLHKLHQQEQILDELENLAENPTLSPTPPPPRGGYNPPRLTPKPKPAPSLLSRTFIRDLAQALSEDS